MSAPNFRGMDGFGVWACVFPYNEDVYREQFPDSEGFDEKDRINIYNEDEQDCYEQAYRDMGNLIAQFNDTLKFHKLGLEPGYYQGVEIILLEEPESDDPETLAMILNDADSYRIPFWNYGDSANKKNYQKKARVKYLEELRRIDEWLNTVAFEHGFSEYGVVGRFSNGETWYKEVKGQRKESPVNANEYFFNQNRKLGFLKGGKKFKPLINLRRR